MLYTMIVASAVLLMASAQASGQSPQTSSHYEEPDFAAPADLADQVRSADIVVIARVLKRLEPRMQTNVVDRGDRKIVYTQPYARYQIQVERVLRGDPRLRYEGERIVEQAVGSQGLAEFQRGEPALGNNEVMLFLRSYKYSEWYQFSSWSFQYEHRGDGTVQTVRDDGPQTNVGKTHAIVGASRAERASTDWGNLVQEVEAIARRR